MAFIHCPTGNIAEGQDWRGLAYAAGIYSDGNRTLEKYDTGVSAVTQSDVVLQEAKPKRRRGNLGNASPFATPYRTRGSQ
jgi:hypothetical protein